jgi:hypothetical protein
MDLVRFIVACPKGIATGGPEALHQLVQSLNSLNFNAALWDIDKSRQSDLPVPDYEIYGCEWDIDGPRPGDVLVIPEVMADLIPVYYLTNTCVFWWLSVDNFFSANKLPLDLMRECFPEVIHCFQSEYARLFLEANNFNNVMSLSDYINPDFLTHRDRLDEANGANAQDLKIAINPAKGLERANRLMELLPAERFVKLEKMSRLQVIQALEDSDYYIDLGTHPGKDRFPREAALLNCIILSNKRGSANNDLDISIPAEIFKVDDSHDDFSESLVRLINQIDKDIYRFHDLQRSYRNQIRGQKQIFEIEVKGLSAKATAQRGGNGPISTTLVSNLISFMSVAVSERDSALSERDSALSERDSALSERDSALSERDSALSERDSALSERDTLEHEVTNVLNSFSWRFTYPIRLLHTNIVKRMR